MALSDHPKAYGTAAVVFAFTTGILVTLGFKDFYPDLERRFQRKRRANTGGGRRSSLFWGDPVELQDHESQPSTSTSYDVVRNSLVDGIEATIGNTPLIKIQSLSEATGRIIMAKAEFLNGAGNSPKDRVALNMIREAE